MVEKDSDRRQPAVRRALYVVTAASMAVPLLGVATAPILAQSLGVTGRGELAAAIAPYSLLISVATLGLPEALTFYLAKNPRMSRAAIGFASAVTLAFGSLCFAATFAYADTLTNNDQILRSKYFVQKNYCFDAKNSKKIDAYILNHF